MITLGSGGLIYGRQSPEDPLTGSGKVVMFPTSISLLSLTLMSSRLGQRLFLLKIMLPWIREASSWQWAWGLDILSLSYHEAPLD